MIVSRHDPQINIYRQIETKLIMDYSRRELTPSARLSTIRTIVLIVTM